MNDNNALHYHWAHLFLPSHPPFNRIVHSSVFWLFFILFFISFFPEKQSQKEVKNDKKNKNSQKSALEAVFHEIPFFGSFFTLFFTLFFFGNVSSIWLFSTLTQPSQRKPRMLQSNTTCTLSMKSKLLLLQRLGEDSEPNKDYNPQRDQALKLFMLNANDMMLKSMNSYPTSVVNLGSLRDPFLETSLTQMTMPMTLTSKECNLTESIESSNPKCCGSLEKMKRDIQGMKNARNLADSSPYSLKISKPSSYGSKTPEQHRLDSQLWSGTTLSEDRPSTLMPCSHCCTIYLECDHQSN